MTANRGVGGGPIGRRRVPTRAVAVLALVAVAMSLIVLGYGWSITGFGGSEVVRETTRYDADGTETFERSVERRNPRTVWDWIGLVGVGSAITLVGLWIARKQKERDEGIASDRAQEEALQAYLDKMSILMIEGKIGARHGDPLGENARRVAQARTKEALLVLDKDHKRRPLKLLYELGLIDGSSPVIALDNAGLDHACLGELSLREACLARADLRATDLSGSDLRGTDLSGADLRGADMRNADLSHTDLTRANLLPYDENSPARLSIHNLEDRDAVPSDAELRFKKVVRDVPTNLSDTNLEGADLTGALLGNTDLRSARGLTQGQIERAIGNKATRLPDTLARPESWGKPLEEQMSATEEPRREARACR